MTITTTQLLAAIGLCFALLAMTYQPDDSVAWQAGDGAKHYGEAK